MVESFTEIDILKTNPHISVEELEASRQLLRALRKNGMKGRGYTLAPPFGGKMVSTSEEADNDRRMVQLSSCTE